MMCPSKTVAAGATGQSRHAPDFEEEGGGGTAPAAREPGFYWIKLGHNMPEVAYFFDGVWWLSGADCPWDCSGVQPLSGRLKFDRASSEATRLVLASEAPAQGQGGAFVPCAS